MTKMNWGAIFRTRCLLCSLVVVALIRVGILVNDPPRRRWKTPSNVPVQVDFDARIAGNLLVVSYTVKNRTTATILVFDQIVDDDYFGHEHKDPKPDPGWSYVDFVRDGWSLRGRRHRIVLSRRQRDQGDWPCYSAQVPFGRPLSAGMTLSGEFRLPLPLRRRSARGWDPDLQRDEDALESVQIGDAELQIGWSAEVPTLSAADREVVEMTSFEGKPMWYITYAGYDWVRMVQQIASSTSRPVRREGDDLR
jgi:hypothetical protein